MGKEKSITEMYKEWKKEQNKNLKKIAEENYEEPDTDTLIDEISRRCVGCNEEIPFGHFKCLMCGSQSFYDVKRDKTEKKVVKKTVKKIVRKKKKTALGQFSDGPDTKSLARGVSRPSKGLGKVLKEEAESLMTYYCNSCGYVFKMISMASGDYGQTCMKCGSSDLESESTPIETADSVRSFMYE